MKTSDIKALVGKKSVKDYTYAILFLVVASFFAFAVIRPVLGIAIKIRREGQDLERINAVYEKNITRVLELQSQIESTRSRRYLLDDAIPPQPMVDGIIRDIERAAIAADVRVENVKIDPIAIKSESESEKGKKAKARNKKKEPEASMPKDATEELALQMTVKTSYAGMGRLMREILNQRRIKRISLMTMSIDKRKQPEQLANGEIVMSVSLKIDVDSYYAPKKTKVVRL